MFAMYDLSPRSFPPTVSGSNKGIGLEIVRRLAQNPQFSVIMCSRNIEDGRAAAASLGGRVDVMQLDIESDDRYMLCDIRAAVGT
jgi:NAD(P)-dependent dehydrogenase (short-subunit alcohol dehydrogenase family)